MGKRIKKLKRIGGAEIEQANHAQTSLGVRTRAKTLALQNAKMLSLSTASTIIEDGREKGSYLQLRSQRLKRLPLVGAERNGKNRRKSKGNGPSSEKDESGKKLDKGQMLEENGNGKEINGLDNLEVVETSFGENELESESKERATRVSSPSNLITNPEMPTNNFNSTSTIFESPIEYFIPPIEEMNELFANAEEKQKNDFIEKYNFDPVKDEPLPGRFEWEKVKP